MSACRDAGAPGQYGHSRIKCDKWRCGMEFDGGMRAGMLRTRASAEKRGWQVDVRYPLPNGKPGPIRDYCPEHASRGVETPGTMGSVPNKPKTPVTNFRIPEDLKRAAVEKANAEGKTLTDIVVESLTRYVKRSPKSS